MARKPATDAQAVFADPAQPRIAKEKEKAIGFVNWRIADEIGETLIRSSKGFALYDNKFSTLEEKALFDLAVANGGTAIVAAELRIIVAQEKPDHLDISKIKLVK